MKIHFQNIGLGCGILAILDSSKDFTTTSIHTFLFIGVYSFWSIIGKLIDK